MVPSVSRKRPLSLCILGGRLREVRLFSTFNITLGKEMFTTKKKIKLLANALLWLTLFTLTTANC